MVPLCLAPVVIPGYENGEPRPGQHEAPVHRTGGGPGQGRRGVPQAASAQSSMPLSIFGSSRGTILPTALRGSTSMNTK